MDDSLSGGTSNLLRMARSGCQSAVSFVALSLGDQQFASAMYPPTPDDESLGAEAIDDLVRQLWLDPGLGHGKALVRTIRLGGRRLTSPTVRLAVAAVPLGTDAEGRPWGVLGVADPHAKSFGLPELELLAKIAQRLASYVRARHEVRVQLSDTAVRAAAPAGAAVSAPGEDRGGAAGATPATHGPAGQATGGEVPGSAATSPRPAQRLTEEPTGVGSAASTGVHVAAHVEDTVRAEPWWSVEPGHRGPAGRAQPPFPPPAGTVGPVPRTGAQTAGAQTAGARTTGAQTAGAPNLTGAGRRRVEHDRVEATWVSSPPEPASPRSTPQEPDLQKEALGALLGEPDPVTGLLPLGALLARAGRLLGAGAETSGTLVVVAVEIGDLLPTADDAMAHAADALRAELRFDDPIARIDRTNAFAAVVPLLPGGVGADVVEGHLVDALRTAVAPYGGSVRAAHVVADLDAGHDADDLLRSAVGKLRAS